MESFYVTLTSDSSKPIFGDENSVSHFTTQLAAPICTSQTPYECAVTEVFLPTLETWKFALTLSPIFLYSDISKPVHVGDSLTRLLRVLPPQVLSGHHSFTSLYYHPVDRQHINSITLSFHSNTGQRYFFSGSEVSIVVLHFRPIFK